MKAELETRTREQIEEAFALGEANVGLEGFIPAEHPLYKELKQRVIAGDISAADMGAAIVEHSRKLQMIQAAA